MSRAKKRPVILGPDGRPYVAPPKKAEPRKVSMGFDAANGSDATVTFTADLEPKVDVFSLIQSMMMPDGRNLRAPKPRTLREAVAADISALTADFEGETREELPRPPADLTSYADAFASAQRNCPHEDVTDTIHAAGQFFCNDCSRYLTRGELMAARRKASGGGFFRWFGA